MKTLLIILLVCGLQPLYSQNKAMHLLNTALFYAPIPSYSLTNFTMEVWIKPEREDEHSFPLYLGTYFGGYGFHFHNGVNGNKGKFLSITIASASYSAVGNPLQLPLKKWTHVALTHDSLGWRMYRNGEYVGNGNSIVTFDSTSKYQTAFFTGAIDEARFWNTTRSQKEIQSSFQHSLTGNELGLVSYYNFDSFTVQWAAVVENNTPDTSKNGVIYGDGNTVSIEEGAPLIDENYPDYTFIEKPSHYQFFARDEMSGADVRIAGKFSTVGWDSLICVQLSNDLVTEYQGIGLKYSQNVAQFEFKSRITATPTLYTYRIYARRGKNVLLIGESADLSCGDVYLISGQSNSHPADDSSIYVNPLLKTWGIQTFNGNLSPYNVADSSWGMANGHGFNYFFRNYTGPYLTGVWGIELQRLLLEKYKIPSCIMNVGGGSSSVYSNQRDDNLPTNLSTIYGRGLYRTNRAKLTSAVKAIFWYQGEGESGEGYAPLFNELYKDWEEDYPNAKMVYVFQLHLGCAGIPHLALRELQRTFPKHYKNIRTIGTNGLRGFDSCHYSYDGYLDIGEKAFWQLERDFYGRTDTQNITSPDIKRVYYSSAAHDEITIIYAEPLDEYVYPSALTVGGKVRAIEDYFYLDGIYGNVRSGRFTKDTLRLTLNGRSDAKTVTYLPETFYNGDDSILYQGPWIVNKRGVGALSFYNVPIMEYPSSSIESDGMSTRVYYEATTDEVVIESGMELHGGIEYRLFNLLGESIAGGRLENQSSGVYKIGLSSLQRNQWLAARIVIGGKTIVLPIVRVQRQ